MIDLSKIEPIKPGSVLVIKSDKFEYCVADIMEISKALHNAPDCAIVVLNPGESIECLDEEQMRELGWVRAV